MQVELDPQCLLVNGYSQSVVLTTYIIISRYVIYEKYMKEIKQDTGHPPLTSLHTQVPTCTPAYL